MMAFSQVEIVPPSHFGCILKKLNHKDMSKDTKSESPTTSLKNNIKEFVRDQFQSCIPTNKSENSNTRATKKFHRDQNIALDCWGKNKSGYDRKGRDEDLMFPMYIKQSRVIDEWATQQAKDMINNTKKRQNEDTDDDFSSLSKSHSLSSRESCLIREPSPTPSDNSSTDFSVSSLVQKWRGFEAESRNNQTNNNNNNNNNNNYNNNSSTINSQGPTSSAQEQQENVKDVTMPREIIQQKGQVQHEQIQVESISTSVESISTSVDRKEEERMRVVDIVRRLANCNHGVNDEVNQECKSLLCSSLMSLKVGMDIKDQQGIIAAVISSPKLRGRQAISEFFNRMEKNRYQEVEAIKCRQPVSKFPHRGRIQSLLRFKFLRREVCPQYDNQLRLLPKKCESTQSETTSTIYCLRKKYNTVKNQETSSVKNTHVDVTDVQDQEKMTISAVTCKQEEKDSDIKRQDEKLHSATEEKFSSSRPSNDNNKNNDNDSNKNNDKNNINNDKDYIRTHENLNKIEETRNLKESNKEENNNVIQSQENKTVEEPCVTDNVALTRETIVDNKATESIHRECSLSNMLQQHNSIEEDDNHDIHIVDEVIAPITYIGKDEDEDEDVDLNEEDEDEVEEEDYNLNMLEPNLDWTIDIARPRSYWEDRRQTWYQEIFETHPQDEEIRQLLERGSVSAVLASDFRERMDRLVMSSLQRVFYTATVDEDEECFQFIGDVHNDTHNQSMEYDKHDEEQEQNNVLDLGYSSVHLDEHQPEENDYEIAEVDEEDDEEEPTTSTQKYKDISEDYDETQSSSQFPWIRYHDDDRQETISDDNSDNVASTSVQEHSRYHSYYDEDTRRGSSSVKNFSSIEMELIFDLRAHMDRLHSEMAELRKSITTCMDVQVKLQQSFMQGIPTACNVEEQRKRKKANAKNIKKGGCCICRKKPVDSLLYRCGHMCTCFDCAKELEWNNEKCPKCEAQIVDVVRIRNDL